MSRLTDLIRQAATQDPALGADLEAEFRALSERRVFGLNFERHRPEAVELPSRPVRKGDKVRILPPRGSTKRGDQRLWRVSKTGTADGSRVAHLSLIGSSEPEDRVDLVEDLVVVAEFRDPIYPGLVSTGKVERGGDRPFHTVINAENYHALQTLLFTHRGRVDAVYIDPPYNTGAKDWKYNNDYVDGEDLYRHSKWLAFMERRLLLAKELLNPDDSVLVVTIDEKEYLRLGLLLEQTFPDAKIQMISSVISQKGSARTGEFSRCNEFLYFVMHGTAAPLPLDDDMLHDAGTSEGDEVEWGRLRRNGANGKRSARPNLFYPIFVNRVDGTYHSTGSALPLAESRESVTAPLGTVPIFPIGTDGTEMSWGLRSDHIERYARAGYLKLGTLQEQKHQKMMIYYLTSGYVEAAEKGGIVNAGTASAPKWVHQAAKGMKPMTIWNKVSHDAGWHGSRLLDRFIPGRSFPFAKSLYAIQDALRFFVADKRDATVVDFFSGSGTTAHAVMRLNHEDGGRRRAILVTNNEVAANEQRALRNQGLRPGDADWEQWGICEYVTKPRIKAAVTGDTPSGIPVQGDYKYADESPMAQGFEENVEFFTLTYETPWRVARHRAFFAIAPLLWMRAGAQGRRIEKLADGWDVTETYGVLEDLDQAAAFVDRVGQEVSVKTVFVVTDDDRRFQMVCAALPDRVEPVRLYESYLLNFEINSRKD